MNREQIMQLEGKELDIEIAIRVMGFEASKMRDGWVRIGALATYPKRYSTDISAAWEVVEKAGEQFAVRKTPKGYIAHVITQTNEEAGTFETAPEAICKIALLAAMEVET